MNLKSATLAVAAMVIANAHAQYFYDHSVWSGHSYSAGSGDTDGGLNDFGTNSGLQEGQLVTARPDATIIGHVRGDFLQFSDSNSHAWVSVYDFLTGATIGDQYVDCTKSYFTDQVFGLLGVTYDSNCLIAGLIPGRQYLVSMQLDGPSWGFICRDVNGLKESYVRDFSHHGYGGGYGTTVWTSAGDLGFGDGQTCMVISAPEPTSLVALAVSLAVLARRRR